MKFLPPAYTKPTRKKWQPVVTLHGGVKSTNGSTIKLSGLSNTAYPEIFLMIIIIIIK